MRGRNAGCRGTSLIEVVISVTIGVAILTAAASVTDGLQRSGTGVQRRTTLGVQAAAAGESLFRDLRVAGIRAKDANGNGLLDSGEDANRNGRLDADWSLADGREIPIEQRDGDEIRYVRGRTRDGKLADVEILPEASGSANYGFDVTPARLVSGIVTERGIGEASREGLARLYPERDRTSR